MPNENTAEISVIGALIGDSARNAAQIFGKLNKGDFETPLIADVFGALHEMYLRSEAIDIVTAAAALDTTDIFSDKGETQSFLVHAIESSPTYSPGVVANYINCVKNEAARRAACKELESALESARTTPDPLTAANQAIAQLARIAPQPPREKNMLQALEDLKECSAQVHTPINTGFPQLNSALDGGLYPGLYIIGAGTSAGKSTLTMQIGDYVARNGGYVLAFQLEMSAREICARSLAALTYEYILTTGGNSGNAITMRGLMEWQTKAEEKAKKGNSWNQHEQNARKYAFDEYAKYASRIITHESVAAETVDTIAASVREYVAKTHIKPLVIVDYLQIIPAPSDRMTEKATIDYNVLTLKQLSRDLDLTVLLVQSLSRAAAKAELTNASGSGSAGIEYGADVLLWLDFRRKDNEKQSRAERLREMQLEITKNRNGQTTRSPINLAFYTPCSFFFEEQPSNTPEPEE